MSRKSWVNYMMRRIEESEALVREETFKMSELRQKLDAEISSRAKSKHSAPYSATKSTNPFDAPIKSSFTKSARPDREPDVFSKTESRAFNSSTESLNPFDFPFKMADLKAETSTSKLRHPRWQPSLSGSERVLNEVRSLRDEIRSIRETSSSAAAKGNNSRDNVRVPMTLPPSIVVKEALSRVPEFNGNNLTQFVNACRRASRAIPPEVEEDWIDLLKGRLNDRAFVLVEDDTFESVEDFTDRLKQLFAPFDTINSLKGKLDMIRLEVGEPMLSYIGRVSDLHKALLDRIKADSGRAPTRAEIRGLESDAIAAFRDGIPPDSRILLNTEAGMSLCQVFDDALALEKRAERDRAKHGHRYAGTNRAIREVRRSEATTIGAPANSNPSLPRNQPATDRAGVEAGVTCFYCGRVGHVSRACRKRAFDEANRSGNANPNPGTRDAPGVGLKPRPMGMTNEMNPPSTSSA